MGVPILESPQVGGSSLGGEPAVSLPLFLTWETQRAEVK